MKRSIKQKATVWLLLFCMVTSLLPVAASPPVEAAALESSAASWSGTYKYKGKSGDHDICFDENGDLIVTGKYLSNSKATLSYHTNCLYFTRESTNGNPGAAAKVFPVDVTVHGSKSSSAPGYVEDTFTVRKSELTEMALYLYEEEELKGKTNIVFYISEGFCLKSRNSASDEWTLLTGRTYSSLSDIRNAAKWTKGTWNGFAKYYDTQITFTPDELGLNIDPKYDLTVQADSAAGIAYGSGSYAEGEKVQVKAVPNEGYVFKEWKAESESGSPSGFTKTKAETTLIMPSSDVTLTAVFEREKVPQPTKKPVTTPKPGDPTPTPMPTPTLAPTPTPKLPDPSETYGQNVWYYGTEQGYTVKQIYDADGPLANFASANHSHIQSDGYTSLDSYYSVGRDSSGNTWYFLPDGTDATYVHPKVYQGKNADSPQVKEIRELVFPETIAYSGKSYTVTSIGGGTDRYHSYAQRSDSSGNTYTGYTLDKTSGSYYYGSSGSSTSGGRETHQSINAHIGYGYGVIGNGEITSSGSVHFDFFQDGKSSYSYKDYESSYYVYNTTLEFVTIPATVTEICDYAFYQCQGLRKVTGAEGVTDIGDHAFAGARVLTTTPSTEENSNYKRYYYNESYSTGVPTDIMRSWQSAVALREYMELAEFPVLDTICGYAFAYRKNLFDVKLPSCVSVIKDDAFYACDLNTIEIPGKNTVIGSSASGSRDTLGTKGNPDTIIITVPESKAMYYGLKYEDYYTLRCGYPVTYDKNALPAEKYVTASMLSVLKKEIKDSFSGEIRSYGSSGYTYISGSYEVVLDTEGTLWLKKGGALFPSEVMPGMKFTGIKKVTLTEGSDDSGSKSRDYCFAFAEDGKVYLYDPEGTWKDTGIPAGSRGHQWVCSTVKESSSEESSSGYSSGYSGTVNVYYLYYLGREGGLSRKEMYRTESGEFYSNSSGSSCSSDYSILTGSSAETVPVPEGISFRSFYAAGIREGSTRTSASWGDGYSDSRKEYSLYLPDVYAEDTDGNLWRASGGNPGQKASYSSYSGKTETTEGFSDTEMTNQALPASYYTWEREDGVRQVFGHFAESGAYTTTEYLHILDKKGNLLLCKNPGEAQPSWEAENLLKGGKEYGILSGKGFVSAEIVTENYALLTGADGSTWVYLYRNAPSSSYSYSTPPHKPRKLAGSVQITAQWETVRSYSGEGWDSNSYYREYTLFLLDNTGRLWVTKDTCKTQYNYYSDGSSYTSWTSSVPECLLSGVEKLYIHRAGMTDQEVLILDKNGDIWKYTDGRISGITGEEAVADAGQKLRKTAYSTGYEFAETLYANMFSRPGYRFLSWNTEADGSGTSLQPGERLPLTAPATLYAQWERAKNIIRYAPNGGSGVMEDDAYEPDVTAAVLKRNAFVKRGCEFTGWNTKADGSGTSYADGASITMIPGTTVLYAQWKPFSYVVKVAEDEVRVTPVTITDTTRLEYDEEMTIPAALPDKFYTVTYHLNPKTGTSPYWKTENPDADRYTKARLSFGGWQLYEETEDGFRYLGFYKPGTVVKNLAEAKGAVLYLFPYWGGEASYVDLPVAGCKGYDFIGWTVKQNDKTDILYAAEGSGARYKPKGNETLYAYWEPAVSLIILNDRGATSTDHTRCVLVTYGEAVPDIIAPEKEGYTFKGYFTGTRGKGTKYYDENGRLLVRKEDVWEETPAELFACWEQKPAEYPDPDPSPAVTAKPAEAPVDIRIEKTPYAKIAVPGYDAEKAVPSTETAEATLYAGSYAFSGKLGNVTGVKDICIHVKIPYTTRYEDENEELVDSELQYAEIEVPVPKAYSYWKIDSAVIRTPYRGAMTSGVFAETLDFPYTVTDGVFYDIKQYTDEEHVTDPGISLDGETVHIWETENGERISGDRMEEILSVYAKNLAYADTTPLDVKSDSIVIGGKTILSDSAGGSGAAYDKGNCDTAAADIPWVQSSVSAPFNEEAANGVYGNTGTERTVETELTELWYYPLSGRTGTAAVTGFPVNRVTIHTPVVANPEKDTLYQDGEEDSITIKDYTEFLHMDLSGLMQGTHIDEKGYGTRDYMTTVSGKMPFDCIVLDASIPLYFDINGDTKKDAAGRPEATEDDVRFGKDAVIRFACEGGAWQLYGTDGTKHEVNIADLSVYVLATECTSDFDITYGVLAKNGRRCAKDYFGRYEYDRLFEDLPMKEWAQETANKRLKGYFAYSTVSYDVSYKYITFRFYDAQETVAQVSPDGSAVATKQGYEAYFYVTQPEGFDGTMEIIPEFSLVDTNGNLVSDDVLVIYSDSRKLDLGEGIPDYVPRLRRFEGMTPADDYRLRDFYANRLEIEGLTTQEKLDIKIREFRTNWLEVEELASQEKRGRLSQLWTFGWVWMNDASVAPRTVSGTVMDARHGAYRLPNGIRVLKVSDVPDTPIGTREEFIHDWKIRDAVVQSDTELPFADTGYLKVELDVKVINADGTVLAEHGSLPAISLYYTIGDTGEGLYYRYNGIIPEGDGMDDDVEVDYVHVRKSR